VGKNRSVRRDHVAVVGCPEGRTDFNQGRKAQDLQDYDAAFEYYQKALKTDPENAEYQIKFNQAAAAHPISDQRSQRASETVSFAGSPLHRITVFLRAAKRAHNRKHGSATLSA
jgi:tetratricopeptide (TPR) repeat protein